ncbi:FMN-binding split barrel-related protein, partial [Penicillium hispanicum]|uniref:FMN-binding split barrel-related protein n=1 Tax=Penicillium hispanicum TaxID=1080232 RepID=UPI002540EA53
HLAPASLSALSTMTAPQAPRAPWRDLLDSHLQQTPDYVFNIATVGLDSEGRPVPRVRTCGCRGFFPELELHPKGQEDMDQQVEGGGNPPLYESDMLSFTTDIRMEKLAHLDSSGHAIEGMFWLKDLMAQWRVKGRAFAIGDPDENAEHERVSRGEIGSRLRVKDGVDTDANNWAWEKAVTKYFANHSPIMRGSFRNPPPGQPRSQVPEDPAFRLGQKVTDLHDPVARANFRVVAIIPEEVERLDLSDYDNIRRWKWSLVNKDTEGRTPGQWVETELWP